ncbi:MAG: transglutaminase family protein [Pirellulales bacterium]
MIRAALNHKTSYHYSQPVDLGPQLVRLRPAQHCRTPIRSYSLKVTPKDHFINWQQDPHGNFLARLVFPKQTRSFEIEVDLVAEMTVVNPFDFFLEPEASEYPFTYEPALAKDLLPFLHVNEAGPGLQALLDTIDRSTVKTIDFLVELNQRLQREIEYLIRLEPGVQTSEETLAWRSGSCRDSAWLLVEVLRHMGLAARFVSGYLIQLKPDVKSLDGPVGTDKDFTDLHAWTEVFLPGAGWVGLDPTSGLLAGEGHIPLACTPDPTSAAPIVGTVSQAEVEFGHKMSVTRIHEDPRVTKPYTEEQWQRIEEVGHHVDERLAAGSVRLTMGGEPTFVSIDDMEGAEWNTAAVGPTKRRLAGELIDRLRERFAAGGLLHYGQGKWYPGEQLPRWALSCLWRTDGQAIWSDRRLLADPSHGHNHSITEARRFTENLASRLSVNPLDVSVAYEDALYYLWKERRLPVNADLQWEDLEDEVERARLAALLEHGLSNPVGCLLPLAHLWWSDLPRWVSGRWPVRSEYMFLIPGDSPMGLRLPLDSLPVSTSGDLSHHPAVAFEAAEALPNYELLRRQFAARARGEWNGGPLQRQVLQRVGHGEAALGGSGDNGGNGDHGRDFAADRESPTYGAASASSYSDGIVRTALCVEPRDGTLHVFFPPLDRLDDYLELVAAVEQTAAELNLPVIVEGYLPPHDPRVRKLSVTPDPGVIEVNVQPASDWQELVDITQGLYEDARQTRLGTEKFDVDGTHTGTGGGNHVVLGGPTPAESPFLRRPDVLRSLVGYWHNHPSLSYLFSGRFVGPTSQAPRVDEGRRDAVYELQIAFEQIPDNGNCPPWLIDRVLRHLLVDVTGNTHRAEFCIDKLYAPESATGRLGLVEFRAFEMPPHWQMSLAQQLLLRSLVSRFWDQPYRTRLVDWDTSIHDRWLLPEFVWNDFADVIEEANQSGFALEADWFAPHFEFRFPLIGEITQRGINVQLRTAVEPWYVLGEEPAGGFTARHVDSSVERLQVKVQGMTEQRHVVTCNRRKIPLHPLGTEGEFVAGVRLPRLAAAELPAPDDTGR